MGWLISFMASAGAGLLSAMGFGGGGVFLLYLAWAGVPQLEAQGLNLAFILPIGILGLWLHRKNGLIVRQAIWPILLGGLAGVWFGVAVAGMLSQVLLRRFWGILVILLGFRELYQGVHLGKKQGWVLWADSKEKTSPFA